MLGDVAENPEKPVAGAQEESHSLGTSTDELRLQLLEALVKNPLRELPGAEEALFLQLDELARTGQGRAVLANESLVRVMGSRAMALGFLETISAGFRVELPKLPLVCADIITRIDDIISYLRSREHHFRVKRWSEKALHGLRIFGKAVGNITPVAAAAKALGLKADKLLPPVDRQTLERLFHVLEREISVPLARFGAIMEVEMRTANPETANHYAEVLEKLKRVSMAVDACMAFTLLGIYRNDKNASPTQLVFPEVETTVNEILPHSEAGNTGKEKREAEGDGEAAERS